jgi:hypothetical protein
VEDLTGPGVLVVVMPSLENGALLEVVSVAGDADTVLGKEVVVSGKGRLFVRRTHVGEDQAPYFDAGVGGVLDRVLEVAVRWFTRSVDYVAISVIGPPMIETADAALLHAPVKQGCPAVAAVLCQEAWLP